MEPASRGRCGSDGSQTAGVCGRAREDGTSWHVSWRPQGPRDAPGPPPALAQGGEVQRQTRSQGRRGAPSGGQAGQPGGLTDTGLEQPAILAVAGDKRGPGNNAPSKTHMRTEPQGPKRGQEAGIRPPSPVRLETPGRGHLSSSSCARWATISPSAEVPAVLAGLAHAPCLLPDHPKYCMNETIARPFCHYCEALLCSREEGFTPLPQSKHRAILKNVPN